MTTYWDLTGDYVEDWTDEEEDWTDEEEDWTDEELEEVDCIAYESYKSETDSYYWD